MCGCVCECECVPPPPYLPGDSDYPCKGVKKSDLRPASHLTHPAGPDHGKKRPGVAAHVSAGLPVLIPAYVWRPQYRRLSVSLSLTHTLTHAQVNMNKHIGRKISTAVTQGGMSEDWYLQQPGGEMKIKTVQVLL